VKKNSFSLNIAIFCLLFSSVFSFSRGKKRLKKKASYSKEFLLDPVSTDLPKEFADCVDISPLTIDLKYDGKCLKILEFNNLMPSVLRKHGALYGENIIWKRFWYYLKNFGLNIWCIGKSWPGNKKFIRFGSRYIPNAKLLKKDAFFNSLDTKNFNFSEPKIEDYKVIISARRYRWLRRKYKCLRKRPGVLFLHDIANDYVDDKYKTNSLFEGEYLKKFKPEWKVYDARYSKKMIKQIKSDFISDTLVIKPLSSFGGRGVIIVKKDDLDETLKLIFSQKSKIGDMKDKAFRYWKKRKPKKFLIESFEESKHVFLDRKAFDGTMRVVCVLCCNKGKINLSFLGSYWKLPGKAISDAGSLMEKYKSKSNSRDYRTTALKVSLVDAEHVQEILAKILPKLYIKMIEERQQLFLNA